MVERGVIAHRDRAKQIVDFSGLRFGNITPTDIDGLIEYQNRCFLLLEFKHYSRPDMPAGQRVALERLALRLSKPTLLLLALHYTELGEDIDAASCTVHRYFWGGEWCMPESIVYVEEAARGFIEKFGSPFALSKKAAGALPLSAAAEGDE